MALALSIDVDDCIITNAISTEVEIETNERIDDN
jgi:hypothetical protein